MAGIPEEIIERVKLEANLVDVISDYVRLRRAGKNWLGLCPFHDDKRPSFNVEPVRGIYKCFSCGKGGNVFTFLMEHNGWEFPETVRYLAQRLGIEIPEDARDRQEYSENERLVAAVREAGRFYYRTLKSEIGLPAQAYFRKRGFTDETINKFGLGYAPDEWEATLSRLMEAGYSESELDRAGLIIKREGRKGYYDRFRGRTMFPIFTATGRVVGFGARRMTEDPDQPKYINTPETPIYQKSRVLYGLYQAKDSIRKSGVALFVEGYADVISLHQAGVETAIATCGTAMTPEHADLVSRYTSRVVLVFDSDQAGKSATERGIDVLLRQGLDVSVLRLPDGEDPDTFVRKFGAREFERRLSDSVSFLEFRARTLKNAGDFDAPDRKAEAIRSIVSTIALIPDALKRELYVQKLAVEYHLSEGLMVAELERALGRQQRSQRRRRDLLPPTEPVSPPESIPASDSPLPDAPPEEFMPGDATIGEAGSNVPPPQPSSSPSPLRKPVARTELPPEEVGLLSVLVQGDPQLLEHVFARIDPDDFGHPLTRELIGLILGHYVNQRSFAFDELIMEDLAPDLRDLITLLAIERESISQHWTNYDPDLAEPNPWKIARDCLIRIEQTKIEHEYEVEQEKLLDPNLDDEKTVEVFTRLKELSERRAQLVTLLAG